jgi:hypothetical protein
MLRVSEPDPQRLKRFARELSRVQQQQAHEEFVGATARAQRFARNPLVDRERGPARTISKRPLLVVMTVRSLSSAM